VRIRLLYKIIASFVLTSLLMVALMVGILQLQSSKNFADYVGKNELDSLDNIVDKLGRVYQDYQGWERLRDNPRLWHDTLKFGLLNIDSDETAPPEERLDPKKRDPFQRFPDRKRPPPVA